LKSVAGKKLALTPELKDFRNQTMLFVLGL
jgi:hypothetical protein